MKPYAINWKVGRLRSPPAWGRGLKLILAVIVAQGTVAPRVGAWIETGQPHRVNVGRSRPPRGGVD